jgi:hypothetical protein
MRDGACKCREGAGEKVSGRQDSTPRRRREQWEETDGGAGRRAVMRTAKRLQDQKLRVISVDHTCTQCLHQAAAVAFTVECG